MDNQNTNFKGNNNMTAAPYSEEYMAMWRKGNATANKQAVQNNKPKYELDITTIEFDGDNSSKMMSSSELSGMISDIMSSIFVDFEGCIILQDNQFGAPYLLMYFKDKQVANAGNRVKALESVFNNNKNSQGNSMAARFQNAFNRSSRVYQLSEAAKDILSQFMSIRGAAKINWNNCYREIASGNPYIAQSYNILVEIKGFDLSKILKLIYGKTIKVKDPITDKEVKKRVEYSVGIIRPITEMAWNSNNINTNFLLSITQLNRDNVEALAQKLGFGVVGTNGQVPMYRANIK